MTERSRKLSQTQKSGLCKNYSIIKMPVSDPLKILGVFMRKFAPITLAGLIFTSISPLSADIDQQPDSALQMQQQAEQPQTLTRSPSPTPQAQTPSTRTITPFTGRLTKDRVRMRLQPSLEATIVKELDSGDMVIVTGESDDFYAVEPPADTKAYIFRTFVLDGYVEGHRVNVRIAPDMNAPVIAQMNSGDTLNNGTISAVDKKWIEFTPPPSTRFYVAKDYIVKIGDKNMMASIKKRRDEIHSLMTSASQNFQTEMKKPFEQMNVEDSLRKLNLAVNNYKEFPVETARAKALLNNMQEAYLQKKLAAMEAKVKFMSAANATQTPGQSTHTSSEMPASKTSGVPGINSKMAAWQSAEQKAYEDWAQTQPNKPTMEEFYKNQKQNAVTLQGILEPFNRSVKNKPGDYMLVTQTNHIPIAYLYSTQVNLQDKVGQAIALQATPRDNNNFAFPAYFVLAVE